MERWSDLWVLIKNRLISPIYYPKYIFYFVIFILMIAGLGHWRILFVCDLTLFWISLATYGITIGSVAFADVVLIDTSDDDPVCEYNVDLRFLYLCVFLLSIGAAVTSIILNGVAWLAFLSALFSIILWWLINSKSFKMTGNKLDAKNVAPVLTHIDTAVEISDYKV